MNDRFHLAVIMVLILGSIAGCGTVPEGEETTISIHTYDQNDHGTYNPTTVINDGFELNGRLTAGGGAPERDVYRNVSVRIYDSDDRLICTRTVGDWEVSETSNISIELNTVPQYVILYSDDFWEEPMDVENYEYDSDEGRFMPDHAATEDDLPVKVSNKSGTEC